MPWNESQQAVEYIKSNLIDTATIVVYPNLDYSRAIKAKPQEYSDTDDEEWFCWVKRAAAEWMLAKERDREPSKSSPRPLSVSKQKVSFP